MKKEFDSQSLRIFDNKFDRMGIVIKPNDIPKDPSDYPIEILESGNLNPEDEIVRIVESNFAPAYDEVQFTTPGMRNMAERDTALLEAWLGDPTGKRVLDIGPGTGRITLPLSETVGTSGRVYAIETALPYLERLRAKAALAGVDSNRLKLGLGDIQQVSQETLMRVLENEPVDFVTMWFGPLALMTTAPEKVLEACALSLKPGGRLLITTNSLDGLAYRIPEAARRKNKSTGLPLGYQPSIYTRRNFLDRINNRPSGMILGNDQILPAIFYDPLELASLLVEKGLRIEEIRGITRLTGLFPADPSDPVALEGFIKVISQIEPDLAERIKKSGINPQEVWRIIQEADATLAKDPGRIKEFVYIAIKAVKE